MIKVWPWCLLTEIHHSMSVSASTITAWLQVQIMWAIVQCQLPNRSLCKSLPFFYTSDCSNAYAIYSETYTVKVCGRFAVALVSLTVLTFSKWLVWSKAAHLFTEVDSINHSCLSSQGDKICRSQTWYNPQLLLQIAPHSVCSACSFTHLMAKEFCPEMIGCSNCLGWNTGVDGMVVLPCIFSIL